jgi:IPT/TIG domain-containing protein
MDKTRLGLFSKFRALAVGILFCAILLFAHSPVLAAASTLQVVKAANHEVTTGATSTVAITIAAGDLAVVWCSESVNNTSGARISDSSGGKNVWTQTSSGYVSVSPTARGAMFYSSLAAQLTSVTCTWSGGINGRVQTVVYDISGAASSGIEDSSVNSTNTNSITDLLSNASGKTLTTTNANDILLFSIRVTANQSSFAAGTNYTIQSGASGIRSTMSYRIVSSTQSAVSTDISYSVAANNGQGIYAAFKAATGTGGTGPSITSLSPSAGPVGATVVIAGSNFGASQGASTVTFNGTVATPTSWSAASIAVSVPNGATTGNVTVNVGGVTSNPIAFTVIVPPSITSLLPTSGPVGTSVTITGTNFGASQGASTVTFNGTAATPTSWGATSIVAFVPNGATSGNVVVTVGGIVSSGVNFTVAPPPPPPTITTLSPSSAVAGSGPLTITVTGTNFVSSSAVQWNGNALATTFISSTQLQAAVTFTNVASPGAARVTVSNGSFGVSGASTFFVGTTGGTNFAAIVVNQPAQDIVYDPINQVFYLSVPGTAATNPNTIAVLDPATGTITSAQPTGNNPHVLAISDDSQFLYAGIDGASTVQRFILPGLVPDINYPLGSDPYLGPYFALDLQVAPGAPRTTAVSLGNTKVTTPAVGGITIFDDATPRATKAPGGFQLYSSIQWGSDAGTLFASNTESTGFDFYTLTVNSSGVTLNQDFPSRFTSFGYGIHFDPASKLIYSDEGHVLDPSAGLPVGNFNATGVITVDAMLNTAFFGVSPSSVATIQSFDITHFTPINTATIPSVTGTQSHLIRWGQNGLAFINKTFSGASQVILLGGDFVTAAPPFALTPPPAPLPPPVPAPNAPTITSLNPSSAIAGSAAFVLNVTGTQFDPAAAVQFNGSSLTTTYVSSTKLQALIPASDVANPGTASIVVANPQANGGNSSGATFFVGSTGGTSSAGTGFAVQIVNQASKDIAFNPQARFFYLSLGNSSATGNTIAVLDAATATIVGQQYAGSNPNILAISDDSQFLYASIDGTSSVQRFTLPGLATDINYSLGQASFGSGRFALDMQVAPGLPHTTAVTLGVWGISPEALGGITIFDDATARPTIAKGFGPGGGGGVIYDSLQWGSDATSLIAANNESSGFDLYNLSVTPSGVSLTSDFPYTFSRYRNMIHFDRGTNLVYSDDGHVVVPSTGASAGTFPITGLVSPIMVPDSSLNLAFFASQTGSSSIGIYSFNLSIFTPVSSITIPNVSGNPLRLIRWGQNGLAFNTDADQIVLVGGNFVH